MLTTNRNGRRVSAWLWLVLLLLSTSSLRQIHCQSSEGEYFTAGSSHEQFCETIEAPMCMDIPYNMTFLPNLLGHESQVEAMVAIQQFYPLVKIQCSKHLQLFLCSVHFPVCNVLGVIIPPCQSFCKRARRGCRSMMKKFGFRWPDSLRCDRFPEEGLCFGR
ncbi:frizzled-2-like [Diadema antillarum]|uniref:frizzled-2-like n=1 Tax=Diadema antillarum TaxID=105358 RepID=UPI003A86BBD7